MEKRLSLNTAREELDRIHGNIDELQEALLDLIGKPSYVADVLLGALCQEARAAQRVVDRAGYRDYEELLADYMAQVNKEGRYSPSE
jgi:hypothetical protein